MSFSTTQTEIETLFGQVGTVTEVFLPADRATGQPRGFAFVEFAAPSSVPEAISRFDGSELQGRRLKVHAATERERRPQQPNFGPDDLPSRFKAGRPKGSRRGMRGKKRGF